MTTQHDIRRSGATEHVRIGEQSIRHRREFDAPASLVQRAHTDPELFRRWMGPRGTTVRLDRFDAVTGGASRYVVLAPDGGSWAFRGSYHQVDDGMDEDFERLDQVVAEIQNSGIPGSGAR